MVLRAATRDLVIAGLGAVFAATAVAQAFGTHQHEAAGAAMCLAAICAVLVLVGHWHAWPWWQHGVLGLAAALLLADGITYLQPDDCTEGIWKAFTNWWTYMYLNAMSATRILPLAAALGGLALSVARPTRLAGLWALGCVLTMALVDTQLHYVADPDHCVLLD